MYLRAHERAEVRDALEQHLRHEPMKVTRSRIRRLRGLRRPHFRLRVGEIRVFYDVLEATVEVVAIISKETAGWPGGSARGSWPGERVTRRAG